VSDAPPSNLTVVNITATSLELSWEFTLEEKLSPFQGFSVFVGALPNAFEGTVTEAYIGNLKPHKYYRIFVAPRHLVGLGLISEGIWVKTAEWGKNVNIMGRLFKTRG
jgi:hypothetical protein